MPGGNAEVLNSYRLRLEIVAAYIVMPDALTNVISYFLERLNPFNNRFSSKGTGYIVISLPAASMSTIPVTKFTVICQLV
jgi:hypothetical protein